MDRTNRRAGAQWIVCETVLQGAKTYSFYAWRRRLRKEEPVRFALVDRRAARQEHATDAGLELVLATGERLRIGAGVDGATLRTVLEVLRA